MRLPTHRRPVPPRRSPARGLLWALALTIAAAGLPAGSAADPSADVVRRRGPGPHEAPVRFRDPGAAVTDGSAPEWRPSLPPHLGGSRAVHDPPTDRIVIFGAGTHDLTFLLSLAGAPEWSIASTGTERSPIRWSHSAILDPVGRRMIVYGGVGDLSGDFELLGDVWALSLDAPMRWTPLTPSGEAPAPRAGHQAVYDPVRRRMLVLGGPSEPAMRVWALSLDGAPAWSELPASGHAPASRSNLSAVYDPIRDRVVLIRLGSVWVLDLAGEPRWVQPPVDGSAPTFIQAQSAIYDPVRDQVVVHGGFNPDGTYAITWTLTLGATMHWTRLTTGGDLPRGSSAHWAVYDPLRDRMIIRGEASNSHRDAYALDLTTLRWSTFTPVEDIPRLRDGHVGVYDSKRHRLVSYGGHPSSSTAVETYVFDLHSDRWSWLDVPGARPPSSFRLAGAYDPVDDRLVALCLDGSVWALDMAGESPWTMLASGPGPDLMEPGGTYDPVRRRLLIFGGYGPGTRDYRKDLWEFSMVTYAWKKLAPQNPIQRSLRRPAVAYDPARDRLLVQGGLDNDTGGILDDLYELPLSGTFRWNRLSPFGDKPGDWFRRTMVYDTVRDRMLMYAASWENPDDAVMELSLAAPETWRPVETRGLPTGLDREDCAMIFDPIRQRLVLSGGGGYGDTWLLQFPKPARPVAIDIRPGDAMNTVSTRAHGLIPVAIFGAPDFDATAVDPWSLHLSGAPVATRGGRLQLVFRDVDGDGLADAFVHFEVDALELDPAATEATLTGMVPDDQPIVGTDAIRLVPPAHDPPSQRFQDSAVEPVLAVHPVGGAMLRVAYTAFHAGPARLDVFDVVGRRVAERDLGMLQPGRHGWTIDRHLASGLYWVAVTQAGSVQRARVVVLE